MEPRAGQPRAHTHRFAGRPPTGRSRRLKTAAIRASMGSSRPRAELAAKTVGPRRLGDRLRAARPIRQARTADRLVISVIQSFAALPMVGIARRRATAEWARIRWMPAKGATAMTAPRRAGTAQGRERARARGGPPMAGVMEAAALGLEAIRRSPMPRADWYPAPRWPLSSVQAARARRPPSSRVRARILAITPAAMVDPGR